MITWKRLVITVSFIAMAAALITGNHTYLGSSSALIVGAVVLHYLQKILQALGVN